MRAFRFVKLLMPVLVVGGCDDSSYPAAADLGIVETGSFSEGRGVVQSATGSAHRLSGGELFVLTFSANKREDGLTTGRYHADVMSIGATFDVEVTCLSVVGNRAWVAGIIERSDNAIVREGTISYFYAIDNGEGEGDPTDVISGIRVNDREGEDLRFCAERPLLLSSRPIDFGNIQVRP